MRLSTIFYLYRVRLRARLVQEMLAVVGIAVGVALLFASQVANSSLAGSVAQLTNGLIGNARLQLEARDPDGFSERMLSDVERIPGVLAAAPVLQRSAYVVGPAGEESLDLVGLNPGFVRLEGRLLVHVSTEQLFKQTGLALPASVARSIGAGPLQPLRFQVGDRSARALVAVILQASDIGKLVDSRVAIAPLGLAQSLAGMQGRISRILVEPSPGRDAEVEQSLRHLAAGTLDVRPANFEATVFRQAEAPSAQSTELFSAISALVGFLFAFNAMLLTVPQRRSLITDLRLDGYTPLEIVEVMLFDVIALGIIGTLVGLALGDLLSRSLLQAQPGYLSLAFSVGSLHIISWLNVVIAAVGGLMAAVVGVMIPLRGEIFGYRRPGSPTTKMTSQVRSIVALACGLVCVALTTVVMLTGITTVGMAVLAFVSLTFALLLVLPVAFSAVIGVIDRLQQPVMGVSSRIALIELLSNTTRPRSLAIAATGAIAVFGSVAIKGAQGNLRDGLARSAADISLVTDLWVSPPGTATTLATIPFNDRFSSTLQRLPDVKKVALYRGGFLDFGDRRVLILAPPRTDPRLVSTSQVVKGGLTLARSRLQGSGWVTMSEELANERNLHVGDSFTLPTPRPTRFRVAAITTNFGWSPGTIVMNADDYAQAWASNDISAYQVTLKSGVSVAAGVHQVQSAVQPNTALVVQSANQHEQNEIAGQRQGLKRLTDISTLVLIAAALAMAAAIGAMIWQRRPRLAGMKVDGFGQRELWGALLWESVLLLSIGCSIGAGFGLYGQVVLSHALVSVTGFPVVFSLSMSVAAVSLTTVTVIALVVVALPGYLAVQVKPALQD